MATVTPFIKSVEYFNPPAPQKLFKAMEAQYADMFLQGQFRIFPFEFYRDIELKNEEMGDITEGIGISTINGMTCQTESGNPVFMLCTSLISNPDILLDINQKYDAIIEILNVYEFGHRLALSLASLNDGFFVSARKVSYDKGSPLTKRHFLDNAFQKPDHYKHQAEYRFVATDSNFSTKADYLDIDIGSCKDIVRRLK